jgi:hypothetical protein
LKIIFRDTILKSITILGDGKNLQRVDILPHEENILMEKIRNFNLKIVRETFLIILLDFM